MGETQAAGGSQAVDEQGLVLGESAELLALHHFVEVRLAIDGGCRQRRIKAAESTREIATFLPSPRTYTRDGKIGHGNIPGLNIDEQRRCEHLGAQGAQ